MRPTTGMLCGKKFDKEGERKCYCRKNISRGNISNLCLVEGTKKEGDTYADGLPLCNVCKIQGNQVTTAECDCLTEFETVVTITEKPNEICKDLGFKSGTK